MDIDYIGGIRAVDTAVGLPSHQREVYSRLDDIRLRHIDYVSLRTILGNWGKHVWPGLQSRPGTAYRAGEKGKSSPVKRLFLKAVNCGLSLGDVFDRYIRYPLVVRRGVVRGNVKHMPSHEFAYLMRCLRGDKTIITIHHLIPYVVSDFDNEDSLFWRINVREAKKAARIITVSEFTKSELVRHMGYPAERISVIYHGIDHDKLNPGPRNPEVMKRHGIREDARIVLYIGSEHPRKNVHTLVKAFAELKKKDSNVVLVKVGKSAWKNEREKLVRLMYELGIENDVSFIDYVPDDELAEIYRIADVFAFPSIYEGFGVPLLEAMACGTPVVASNASSIPEVLDGAGITVDVYDYRAMADAMHSLLNDDELYRSCVQKGLERVKSFTWEKAARETEKVYREVAGIAENR